MGLQQAGQNDGAGSANDGAEVAIYARVSTDDKGQDPGEPSSPAARMVRPKGLSDRPRIRRAQNVGKGIEHRKQLAAIVTGVARREFELLLVWSLDPFSRQGMATTVAYLQRLASHGVA